MRCFSKIGFEWCSSEKEALRSPISFSSRIHFLVLGVSCDFCMRANFRGKRYKCLVCYDYDLCELCFVSNFNSAASDVSPALQPSSSNAASSTPGGTSSTASASTAGSTSHTSDHAMQCILTQSDFG